MDAWVYLTGIGLTVAGALVVATIQRWPKRQVKKEATDECAAVEQHREREERALASIERGLAELQSALAVLDDRARAIEERQLAVVRKLERLAVGASGTGTGVDPDGGSGPRRG